MFRFRRSVTCSDYCWSVRLSDMTLLAETLSHLSAGAFVLFLKLFKLKMEKKLMLKSSLSECNTFRWGSISVIDVIYSARPSHKLVRPSHTNLSIPHTKTCPSLTHKLVRLHTQTCPSLTHQLVRPSHTNLSVFTHKLVRPHTQTCPSLTQKLVRSSPKTCPSLTH